jgi:hypothetical protein
LELWERFDANKRRYIQQTERLNIDLSQLNTNRSSITSFQQEIETCKVKAIRFPFLFLVFINLETSKFLFGFTTIT